MTMLHIAHNSEVVRKGCISAPRVNESIAPEVCKFDGQGACVLRELRLRLAFRYVIDPSGIKLARQPCILGESRNKFSKTGCCVKSSSGGVTWKATRTKRKLSLPTLVFRRTRGLWRRCWHGVTNRRNNARTPIMCSLLYP